ncbi:carbohydrate ABC transporter permease [Rugosimonospora acidiphila]|uniref:Carbohydrate ABC transporter permease n=1 Tax=Rugosimonospora acidiphila TaxID=556531 RepID=A0ABP9RS40_9ACTN
MSQVSSSQRAAGRLRIPTQPSAGGRRASTQPSRRSIGRIVAWVYVAIILIVTIFPFYWILRTGLSSNDALSVKPQSLWPVGFTLNGFERVLGLVHGNATGTVSALDTGDFLLYLRNSTLYAALMTAFVVFFSTTAAYAFARLHWRGRNLMFSLFLVALMVPGIMTMLPNFVLIKDLGLLNTIPGLILPGALFSAFDVFFLRQFMLGLPNEIDDAARIDGAGPIKALFRVTIPMTAGPITTLSILTFINTWNEYFWPLLVTNDKSTEPLTVGLASFQQNAPTVAPDWSGLMAATLVSALPMLVVFVIFGRRIINSIGFTGIR